ncbi:hypothetical protein AB6E85_08325, partial [Vibrio sp. 10N.247.311.51]
FKGSSKPLLTGKFMIFPCVSVQLTCYLADYTGELSPDAEIEELKFVDGNDRAVCSLAALVALDWLEANQYLA